MPITDEDAVATLREEVAGDCDIVWANDATASTASSTLGPWRATGAANAETCESTDAGWYPRDENDGVQTLRLVYASAEEDPVRVSAVAIAELWSAGRVVEVESRLETGNEDGWQIFWQEVDPNLACPGYLILRAAEARLVRELRVSLDTMPFEWEGIDAVAIVGRRATVAAGSAR